MSGGAPVDPHRHRRPFSSRRPARCPGYAARTNAFARGSTSAPALISAPTHVPNTSTSTRAPLDVGRQGCVGDRRADRVAEATARDAAGDLRPIRTGSLPSATARGSSSTRQRRRNAAALARNERSRPAKSPCRDRRRARVPSYGVTSGVMSAAHTRWRCQAASRSPCSRQRRGRAAAGVHSVHYGRAVLGRAVERPAVPTNVTRSARTGVADRDVAHRHVPKRQLVGRQRAGMWRPRPPQRKARPAGGHVGYPHRAIGRQVRPNPRRIVVAERGAGHDREQLLLDARDREVALDPAAGIEHLRVRDRADLARDAVVAQRFQERGRARPGDLDLGERGLVEERRGLAARGAARRRWPATGACARPSRAGSASRTAAAFASYQLTRSQPDFSPNAAPWAACQS